MGMTSFVIEYICLGQEALSQATCQQILNSVTFVAFRYGHEGQIEVNLCYTFSSA